MGLKGFFGIGSNIGEREKNIIKAIELISNKYPILEYSSIYNTSPVGFTEQDDFLNMVIKFDTLDDDPFNILSFVKSIEKIMGRKDIRRWGPRLIDIDILYIENTFLRTETLNIPHISLFDRDFVLIPLLELVNYLYIDNRPILIDDYIKHKDKVELYKDKEKIRIKVKL